MPSKEILDAQKQYDTHNNEVYTALSALGISDKALEQVLRVVKSDVVVASKMVAPTVKAPTATAELARLNGELICTISYANPLDTDVVFKRNVATRTSELTVRAKRNSYSTITISPTLQKSGSVSVTIWAVVGDKQTQVFFKSYNLKDIP